VSNAITGFVAICARFSGQSARRDRGTAPGGLQLLALTAVVAGAATFGCGTPHATLNITAPSSAVAGSSFTITVTAVYEENRDTVINSSIHFTSSDPAAVLPPDYYYTVNDAGSHTFPNGVTLKTPGSQSITATVVGGPGINGTANVTVSAPTTVTQFKHEPVLAIVADTPPMGEFLDNGD
jgi:hypothetical protein